MLEARLVARVLEESLESTGMLAFAVLSIDGVVLESREQKTHPTDLFPLHLETNEMFQVSSKLQTKIYGLLAAEFWRQNVEAQWIGAEAHERRLVVHALLSDSLLLLVVGENDKSWGELSRHAAAAADQLVPSSEEI